ncbi:MAG: GNAT family N-acetyltransferase [Agarilytica sp.]
MSFSIRLASWSTEAKMLTNLRHIVFVEEQNVPIELELDEFDNDETTQHFIGELDGIPVAAGRLLITGQLGRICILKEHRRKGYGTALLKHIAQHALRQPNLPNLSLNAQTSALGLYEQCYFTPNGETFLDANLPHQRMLFQHENGSAFATLFDNSVIRLNNAQYFSHHLKHIFACGKRTAYILSTALDPKVFTTEVANKLSKMARSHHRVDIKILVQDTSSLGSNHHPIVDLAQRLPSSITLHKLHEPPYTISEGYAVVDQSFMVYFNDEKNVEGFATYRAGPESKTRLEEFTTLWEQHSAPDQNLSRLML